MNFLISSMTSCSLVWYVGSVKISPRSEMVSLYLFSACLVMRNFTSSFDSVAMEVPGSVLNPFSRENLLICLIAHYSFIISFHIHHTNIYFMKCLSGQDLSFVYI